MKKIKVLQVIPSFGVGGAEKLVLDYLKHFNKDRVEVKCVSMFGDSKTIHNEFIKANNLDVVYLDKKPGMDLSMFRKINEVVKEFNPDIIHSHLHTMKYLIYSFTRNGKIRKFHTIHNEPEKDSPGIDKIFNKIAFKFYNCIPIALTEDLLNKVNSFYDIDNAIVVNNGIDLERFKNVKLSKLQIREKLGLNKDAFIIGHVGRFLKQKNHNLLIDIFHDFTKQNKNSYLLLIGDGELKKSIEMKVNELGLSKNVIFLGVRSDIPELITAMDVFLFPSLHEGFPITLIEAQTTGVRCVISDKIDSKSILSENTVSVSLDDSLNKWSLALKDPTIKSKPSGSLDDYDICKVVEKLESIYRESYK